MTCLTRVTVAPADSPSLGFFGPDFGVRRGGGGPRKGNAPFRAARVGSSGRGCDCSVSYNSCRNSGCRSARPNSITARSTILPRSSRLSCTPSATLSDAPTRRRVSAPSGRDDAIQPTAGQQPHWVSNDPAVGVGAFPHGLSPARCFWRHQRQYRHLRPRTEHTNEI